MAKLALGALPGLIKSCGMSRDFGRDIADKDSLSPCFQEMLAQFPRGEGARTASFRAQGRYMGLVRDMEQLVHVIRVSGLCNGRNGA